MATDDERLVVLLEARIRDFEKNLQRASRASGENWRKIEKDAGSSAARLQAIYATAGRGLRTAFATGLGAAGIGGLGAGALIAGASGAARDIAQISAEARKAGVGVEAFQELGYAAQGALVETDALTDGLKELQIRADEFVVTGAGGGAEAFQRLGYGADELKAKLADPAALFEDVIERVGRLDKAAQIRVADEIFGGTGGEQFVRLLDQGNGYIARMRQEARDTGNVINAELVQRAIEIDRAFARISATIGTNLKGALVSVVALMRDFADMLNSVENQSNSTLQRRIDLINAAVENARKSSLAYLAIGGEAGIASRLAERDQLQAQLDSRPATSITVTKPGGMGDLSKIDTPAKKAADDLAKAYANLVAGAEQRIAALGVETATVGMATREAEAFRMEQELLAEAQRAGITLTDAQRQAIASLAASYGDAAAAAEAASQRFDNAASAKEFFAGAGMDAVKGFAAELKQGATLTDALASALDRLSDKLLDLGLGLVLDPILNSLSGGLTKALGFAGGGEVPGFAGGGQVRGPGTGTSDSILARVSAGEHVINAKAASRNRTLLEAINAGVTLPAFAAGGVVGAPDQLAKKYGGRGGSPITIKSDFVINANGGTPQQNDDLAQKIGSSVEKRLRSLVQDELITQMRPGNILWR